jgi:CRISPR-associated endonuclease Csn1
MPLLSTRAKLIEAFASLRNNPYCDLLQYKSKNYLNMKIKNVLGLDIGTNSIGAALLKLPEHYEDYGKYGKIEWLGVRVLPDSDYKKAFELGQTNSPQVKTPAANRREKRGSRRLKHRYILRRSRLIKLFKTLGWLDESFPEDFKKAKQNNIDFKFQISDYLEISDQTYTEFYKEFGYSEEIIPNILKEIKYRKTFHKKNNPDLKLLPEDWIVYFLRNKALSKKIEIPELARIIYILNQRRGFKSSRKDLKQDTTVLPYEEFLVIKNNLNNPEYQSKTFETQFVSISKVTDVTQISDELDKKGNLKFLIKVDDPRMEAYEVARKNMPDWKDKEFTFLITQKIKKGKFEQLQPTTPGEDDWSLCTTALDEKIQKVHYPGKYFYEQLVKSHLQNKTFKIRQFPVYRKRYQSELEAIWIKQCELNPELGKLNSDKETLRKLASVLYPTQSKYSLPKLNEFLNNTLLHIISSDIIYYQRELKSQKNLINECRYEKRIGKERTEDGKFIATGKYGLKCIPKSSPLYQEFRIWQDIHNIRILKREEIIDGKIKLDIDQSKIYLDNQTKEALFELFDSKSNINETEILQLIKELHPENDIVISRKKDTPHSHRINLFSNRESLKGNETKSRYIILFKKADFNGDKILNNRDALFKLWHVDYAITSSDEKKSEKGITKALAHLLPDTPNKDKVIQLFLKLSELPKEYGAYSAMAIKKLLPLMRVGKYWKLEDINQITKNRIEKLCDGEYDESIPDDLRKKIAQWEKDNRSLDKIEDYYGLPTWLTCYVVYGTHSENEIEQCNNADEFNNKVIAQLKNNSLRNPVVEQVVRETLLLIRDLWKQLQEKNEKIDEIHIEMARELKKNSEEKQKIAEAQNKNFEERQRIKKLLKELMNDDFKLYNSEGEIEITHFTVKPNPDNLNDIQKFKLWRDLNPSTEEDWRKKVKDEKIPTEQEIKKYILWLSQNCRSPYTGKIIPLSQLYDSNKYEKEHIIPRAKLKNDSLNNLVIAERDINKAKDKELAANFISRCNGKCVYNGKEYKLLTYEEYVKHVNDAFKLNKAKRKNLLATVVPDDFIERQLNDTRYITRKVAALLRPVVGEPTKIIFTGGAITTELKQNWSLTKEWKKLMLPRFERLESITSASYIKENELDRNDIEINIPENEELDIKRIDHRHHALDALIVAATTREHIRYLNTLSAADTDEEHRKIKKAIINPVSQKIRDFKLPWEMFTKEAREKLEETLVTFKTSNKIISKPSNRYYTWKIENGKPEKKQKAQDPNKKWLAIRKSLFKEPLGSVWIKTIKEVSILKAFEIQINRQIKLKNAEKIIYEPYIYDKSARLIIKDILSKCQNDIDNPDALLKEIKAYLKKNKSGKTYILNGTAFDKIAIAEFVFYKTKRMSLNKKEYVEKLSIEKMANDLPYFNYLSEEQFETFNEQQQAYIVKAGLQVSDTKKMSPLNYLLLSHILEYNNIPKEAFSDEGLENLNKKAILYLGKEIKSITRLDGEVDVEDMFNGAFYETDKGANVYFVIYENELTKERTDFISVSAHKAIERIIKGEPIAEDREGYKKIILSPGDLVYVPTQNEIEEIKKDNLSIKELLRNKSLKEISSRVYQVKKFSGKQCYFLKSNISSLLLPYNSETKRGEFGSQNYQEFTDDKRKIVHVCYTIQTDRLGNIIFS